MYRNKGVAPLKVSLKMSPTHHVMFDLQRRGQTSHVPFHNFVGVFSFLGYGAFTLCEADTDKMEAVPNGNLCWYLWTLLFFVSNRLENLCWQSEEVSVSVNTP